VELLLLPFFFPLFALFWWLEPSTERRIERALALRQAAFLRAWYRCHGSARARARARAQLAAVQSHAPTAWEALDGHAPLVAPPPLASTQPG
jgi:hypothetical protein